MSYDAIIVGSGPNGLAAAITLQQAGLGVLVLEGAAQPGGGLRSAEVTLPGFRHDLFSAIHPLALESPFFAALPLHEHGLEWIVPPVLAAHPADDGSAAALLPSLAATAAGLREDAAAYRALFGPLLADWPRVAADILGPIGLPRHPWRAARFGRHALLSAATLAQRFSTPAARGLWAGLAAHAIQPLEKATTAAIGLVLTLAGHRGGWPLPRGGSQSVADALVAHFHRLGGTLETGRPVTSLAELPPARVVLLDVTPRQALALAGDAFSSLYRWQLSRHRYGPGIFKIDWALREPIPFTAAAARAAGTVHLGGTFEEIARAERAAAAGRHVDRPFVLLTQPSRFDATRAPAGRHTAWAYCHVPHGSTLDRTGPIEAQVERFAPGFRDVILARHTATAAELERMNPNLVGGDITGGVIDLAQLVSRPALRLSPYRTSARGVYLCSSSTPPGGGVHGLCGYHAAHRALRDLFPGVHPAPVAPTASAPEPALAA